MLKAEPKQTEEGLVWKALADPTRRSILDLLRDHPRTTGSLVEHFELSRFGVMKHLEVLHRAGLILIRRQGRERFNHLNPIPIQQIYHRYMEPFAAPSAQALLRLKAQAERGESPMTQPPETVFRALDIHQEIHIMAPAERVWQALTAETVAWWPRDFYVGTKPRGFQVEPRVGGRVFEDWGDGEGVLWATVNVFRKGEELQWVGDLSPDFGGPARSITSFKLVAAGEGTRLEFRDSPYGALDEKALGNLESGWKWLLEDCFKPYAQDGKHPERPETVVAAVE